MGGLGVGCGGGPEWGKLRRVGDGLDDGESWEGGGGFEYGVVAGVALRGKR